MLAPSPAVDEQILQLTRCIAYDLRDNGALVAAVALGVVQEIAVQHQKGDTGDGPMNLITISYVLRIPSANPTDNGGHA
jgi:hypothetical protein